MANPAFLAIVFKRADVDSLQLCKPLMERPRLLRHCSGGSGWIVCIAFPNFRFFADFD